MNLKHKTPVRVQTFNAGQQSAFQPTVITEGGASEITNSIISNLGQVQQRLGLVRKGDDPDTLISHWTFDASSSADDKGDNDGTDTDITYVDGKFGKAASFNGTTSKITIGADTTIDATDLGNFSISAWVLANSDGENNVGRIVDKWSGTKVGYRFWVHTESSETVKLSFEVGYGTTNSIVVTSTTMSISALHRIEAVHNADKSSDIYIDGVLASYGTDTIGVGTVGDDSAVDLTIGNETAASAKTFDGDIDDVRIYDDAQTSAQTDLSKIYGLTRFRVPGVVDKVYRVRSASFEVLDADNKGWTVLKSDLTTDLTTNFVTGRASDGTYRLFLFNGTNNVHSFKTDNSETDEGNTNTDPPRSQQAEWHDNRLFVINSVGDINFSDILDGQTFDRNTNIFRSKNPAKALKSFKEKQLIVYNTKGIQVLDTTGGTPLSDWSFQLFNENVEFDSPRTIINAGDDQIYLAKDGVRLLSRTQFDKIQSGLISQPIQDIIDDINIDAIDKACAWFIDNKYILAIPVGTATENNKVLIWDSLAARLAGNLSNAWTVMSTNSWQPSVFSEFEFSDNKISLLVGDARAVSLVYQGFTGDTDNGAVIESILIGKDHTVDRVTDAIWDPVHVVFDADVDTTVEVFIEVDRGGFLSLGTVSLVGGAPILPIDLPFNLAGANTVSKLFRSKAVGRGKTCRVKLVHNVYNRRPTFVEYTLYAQAMNPRF